MTTMKEILSIEWADGPPLPDRKQPRSPTGFWTEFLKKGRRGQSVLVTPETAHSISNVARRHGISVTTKQEGDMVRLWIVEQAPMAREEGNGGTE